MEMAAHIDLKNDLSNRSIELSSIAVIAWATSVAGSSISLTIPDCAATKCANYSIGSPSASASPCHLR